MNFSDKYFTSRLCHCQKEAGNTVESRKACSDAIKIEDEPRLYCDRAEAYLLEDMFDEVCQGNPIIFHIVIIFFLRP